MEGVELLQLTDQSSGTRVGCIRTGGTDAVAAALQLLTPQRVAGSASPALVTAAEAVHTVTMSAAVCRLAAPRVDTQDGGDTASTAPPAVQFTAQRVKRVEELQEKAGPAYGWRSYQ